MNEFDEAYQYHAHKKLLSAVITLAIDDAQVAPMGATKKKAKPSSLAIEAIRFLFEDYSDGYLVALDIDPQQFRRRLINKMYKEKSVTTKRLFKNPRAFCYNYEYYYNQYATQGAKHE